MATRPRHAGREALSDHVVAHPDDRNGRRGALDCRDAGIPERHDDIRVSRNKVVGECRQVGGAVLLERRADPAVQSNPSDARDVFVDRVADEHVAEPHGTGSRFVQQPGEQPR